jgi:Putative adhesin
LAMSLGVAGQAAAEQQVRTFRQTFPLPAAGAALRLGNLAGRIDIVPGPGPLVVVDATVHAEASGAGESQRLAQEMRWVQAEDSKGREEWALSYPVDRYRSYFYPQPRENAESSFWSLFSNGSSSSVFRGEHVRVYTGQHSSAPLLYADLRITVPAAAVLTVRNLVGKVHAAALEGTLALDTVNGDIHVDSFGGQLRLDTGSGDVWVGMSRGETSIETGSGDVLVRQLVGNATVDTGSGEVRIDKVAVGKLAIHTGSGDVIVNDGAADTVRARTGSGKVALIHVEGEDLLAETGSGDVEVVSSLDHTRHLTAKTGSGDVKIYAGAAASFDVTADQGSGDLQVEYGDAVLRHGHRHEKVVGARRGDARTTIRIETSSGDCVIAPRAAAIGGKG